MVACAVIGDSIAVGVGQARPGCEVTAQVGISSQRYISSLLPLAETGAETTIISLGVNDGAGMNTLSNLRQVRADIHSPNVIWLLPGIKEQVRDWIATVARENGDRTLDTRPFAGGDHLHPTGLGYQKVAGLTYGESGSSYAYSAPLPNDEVAEAPAGGPSDSYHLSYSDLSSHHVYHGRHSLALFGGAHRLSATATPRERIHNLRAARAAERTPTHRAPLAVHDRAAHTAHLSLPIPPNPVAARHGPAAVGHTATAHVSTPRAGHIVAQSCTGHGCARAGRS